jgi:GNAT superfamily N-acetyltransferase
VSERVTLVAEQRNRVAAAAHLLRYYSDDRAGPAYRDAGEIRWLLYWPAAPAGNPYWPDLTGSAEALIAACADVFGRWGVTRQHADGQLPVPGVYGVPEQWPHIAALYRRAGFTHTGHTEVVYLAQVKDLPSADAPPLDGLAVRRSVGINGCRFSAVLGEEVIGYIETEVLDKGERMSRHGGWADVGNLHVASPHRRRGVGSWLLGQAAGWLRLAGANRLLNYAWLEGTDPGGLNYDDYRAFLSAVGFRELTRTERGWTRE